MSQNPAHRAPIRRPQPQAKIPTLGRTCRLLRRERKLTFAKAYALHGVSRSYLSDVEKDTRPPSLDILERMIEGYDPDPLMARHLRELRAPAEDLPPTDYLRQCVRENTAAIDHLRDLDDRGVLAAYLDPLWNMLACNSTFRTATPGLGDTVLLPAWLFSPSARDFFLDWSSEATHTVASHKAILGRYRDSEQARHFMQILGQNPEFVRYWTASIRVAYGRNASDLLHLLDPTTGEPASYSLSISNLTQSEHVLLVTAIRKPYSGPALRHPPTISRHARATRR
ncbi:helix-turn-helix domain-containing protein [Nocardia sp. NPDC050793]|uniref:helix-turn-helix domain-containing protein n=1 Tax=Nocardia sp. NPDC050793 TaxID=3155159 RepID=UPI003407B7AA